MNCGNCNSPLQPGNPVCPTCGAYNDLSSIQIPEPPAEAIMEEEETVVEQAPADMAPPSLEVNNENLTENVRDLGTGDDTATVDPEFNMNEHREEIHEDLDSDDVPEYAPSGDSVNIAIPSVSKPVDVVEIPTDGTAPSIDMSAPTLGVVEKEEVKQFKIGGKTIKIKMGKKRNVPQVILIGGIVIFFIIGIMVGSTLFKQNVCIGTANRNNVNTKDLKFVADGNNNITKAGNYTFKIPKEYTYDKINGGVQIYDSKGTWRLFIKAVPGSYDNMATAKLSIKESLGAESIRVVEIKETKINDKNHLILETSKNLVNRLQAFVNAGHDNVFFIEIVDLDNNFNYEILNVADDIIGNAEYNQKEVYVETVPIIDITDISVNAAEAHKSILNKAVDNE